MLRKANQKRLLDELVIEQGEFDWRQVKTGEFDWRQVRAGELDFSKDQEGEGRVADAVEFDWQGALAGADDARIENALAAVEESVDVDAARMATREERTIDVGDFGAVTGPDIPIADLGINAGEGEVEGEGEEDGDDGLSPVERYMLRFVESDWEFFS